MALVLGVITATTGIGNIVNVPQMVYAQAQQATATEKATATKNVVNIAFGGKTVKIAAYNVDGYNYLRVADIGMVLGMKTIYYVTD